MIFISASSVIGAAGAIGGGAFKWLAARHAVQAERARTRRLLIHAVVTTLLAIIALAGAWLLK